MRTMVLSLMLVVGCVYSAGCASRPNANATPTVSASAAPTGSASAAGWRANGMRIFQTGKDIDGIPIVAQPPPLFNRCADCHHANGAGGKMFADGAVSADLRHAALVTHQRDPYTLALLERAIAKGIDNEGKPLDRMMPRWKLSARDLHDVSMYVLNGLK